MIHRLKYKLGEMKGTTGCYVITIRDLNLSNKSECSILDTTLLCKSPLGKIISFLCLLVKQLSHNRCTHFFFIRLNQVTVNALTFVCSTKTCASIFPRSYGITFPLHNIIQKPLELCRFYFTWNRDKIETYTRHTRETPTFILSDLMLVRI